jgi:hypothetical protein
MSPSVNTINLKTKLKEAYGKQYFVVDSNYWR